MKRQIIKTRSKAPYVAARVILAVVVLAALVFGVYELAMRAGLHFH